MKYIEKPSAKHSGVKGGIAPIKPVETTTMEENIIKALNDRLGQRDKKKR
jgi:hypothetical protein